jgi:hypothetical protein
MANTKEKFTSGEIAAIAQRALEVLDFSTEVPKEYFYAHLGLCITDAVYSINALYDPTTKNVVARYCSSFRLNMIREPITEDYPQPGSQQSIDDFYGTLSEHDPDTLARDLFQNRQRTSTGRSGILKAEAVVRFAQTLLNNGVNYFQDLSTTGNGHIEDEIRRIPGQGSGVCLDYFSMLAGNSNLLKPDRMIKRFLGSVLGFDEKHFSNELAIELLTGVHQQVVSSQNITLRHFDHLVWDYQRKQKTVQ